MGTGSKVVAAASRPARGGRHASHRDRHSRPLAPAIHLDRERGRAAAVAGAADACRLPAACLRDPARLAGRARRFHHDHQHHRVADDRFACARERGDTGGRVRRRAAQLRIEGADLGIPDRLGAGTQAAQGTARRSADAGAIRPRTSSRPAAHPDRDAAGRRRHSASGTPSTSTSLFTPAIRFGAKVDHRDDQPADQRLLGVVHRELGARMLDADLRPEVHLEMQRRLDRRRVEPRR